MAGLKGDAAARKTFMRGILKGHEMDAGREDAGEKEGRGAAHRLYPPSAWRPMRASLPPAAREERQQRKLTCCRLPEDPRSHVHSLQHDKTINEAGLSFLSVFQHYL